METKLNELQQLRLLLAKETGFDVQKAGNIYDFIIGDHNKVCENVKCDQRIPTKFSSTAPQTGYHDGIYLIMPSHRVKLYSDCDQSDKQSSIGVAVKMGPKWATVALHDILDGAEVPLVKDTPCGADTRPMRPGIDSLYDMEGQANTQRLIDDGDLSDEILNALDFDEQQYVPSRGELMVIAMNIKEINAALSNPDVGGTPLKEDWYWSSTENSSYYAWYVYFSNGNSSYHYLNKYSTGAVRPAVAITL